MISDFLSPMKGARSRAFPPPKAARVPRFTARSMARTNAGLVSG
jgi:hypothetical protein